ncbi:Os03g0596800, partial [Oryza sativa Japonica Group]
SCLCRAPAGGEEAGGELLLRGRELRVKGWWVLPVKAYHAAGRLTGAASAMLAVATCGMPLQHGAVARGQAPEEKAAMAAAAVAGGAPGADREADRRRCRAGGEHSAAGALLRLHPGVPRPIPAAARRRDRRLPLGALLPPPPPTSARRTGERRFRTQPPIPHLEY